MKKPKSTPLLLSFADYERLSRILVSVLNSVDAHTANGCVFFTMVGSYILDKAFGLKTQPVCGSAFFRVDDATDFVMAFTGMETFEKGEVASHNEAFHAWIECNGVVIDLMAPIFRENLLKKIPDSKLRLPRKMFQRPKSEMANSPFELVREGDFYLQVNPALTNELIKLFMSRAENGDLADVCRQWFKPTPKAILSELGLASNDGTQRVMKLEKLELVGKW